MVRFLTCPLKKGYGAIWRFGRVHQHQVHGAHVSRRVSLTMLLRLQNLKYDLNTPPSQIASLTKTLLMTLSFHIKPRDNLPAMPSVLAFLFACLRRGDVGCRWYRIAPEGTILHMYLGAHVRNTRDSEGFQRVGLLLLGSLEIRSFAKVRRRAFLTRNPTSRTQPSCATNHPKMPLMFSDSSFCFCFF